MLAIRSETLNITHWYNHVKMVGSNIWCYQLSHALLILRSYTHRLHRSSYASNTIPFFSCIPKHELWFNAIHRLKAKTCLIRISNIDYNIPKYARFSSQRIPTWSHFQFKIILCLRPFTTFFSNSPHISCVCVFCFLLLLGFHSLSLSVFFSLTFNVMLLVFVVMMQAKCWVHLFFRSLSHSSSSAFQFQSKSICISS